MMANAERMQRPAEYLLSFKADLGLTADQVGLLDNVAKSQRDSVPVRMKRLMETVQSNTKIRAAGANALAWSGPIDEKLIRAAACEQATAQTEIMIGIMRDRHVAGGDPDRSAARHAPDSGSARDDEDHEALTTQSCAAGACHR